MKEYSDADEKAKDLAKQLLETEQSNFGKMKKFLHDQFDAQNESNILL